MTTINKSVVINKRRMNDMRLSYHSFGFAPFVRWTPCYTLEDTIKKLVAIDFEGIELGAVRPHAWPYDLNASDRRKLLRLLQKEKMEVSAVCPTAINYNVASSLIEERIAAVHYYEECIKMAADFECNKMLYIPGWVTW